MEPMKLFQLTTSRGGLRGRRCGAMDRTAISTHDLTRRSTRDKYSNGHWILYFNSRPRKEVDLRFFILFLNPLNISTHDLARRSTYLKRGIDLLKTFQLTTSQGGRQYSIITLLTSSGISTHDLARRSTDSELFCIIATLFQLTTSQGGRRL